jgi:hypothetical protein
MGEDEKPLRKDMRFTISLQHSDCSNAINFIPQQTEVLDTASVSRIKMVKSKPATKLKARPPGKTERRLVCQGCGERGSVIYLEDGTSSHLTGLFYFYKQKRLDGSAVIACGRCQQIYLGHNHAKMMNLSLALNEQK